ncbi:sigma54 specific transcriptional regulator with PAS/PAC sensor, Fis family [Desulfomicrobium baculatum DSM 4028]|uniref:Sigma54 specific transcriptional regulator with PAS/PAC sensor, Fis family n=2 Tax=Desulfomicrobium baculatum TaxID=899 RepID=C7LTG8_DESBD|nr:sigma54 specific transcriptional regulator with PAS/PAC sensor, Fis family [Desulfomicrobium baculatum DSM 4028]
MKLSNGQNQSLSRLRKQAEKKFKMKSAELYSPHTEADARRMVQELAVQLIELEMRNKESSRGKDELTRSLEKYTDLYAFAPIGYFTLNRGGEIRTVNLAGAVLLGLEQSVLLGLDFKLFVLNEASRVFSDFLDRVFASQVKESCEFTLKSKHAPALFVRADAVARDSTECFVTIIDVTAHKQTERALRESERLYRAIGESIEYGVWVCAPDGRNIYASESLLNLLGITQEQCSNFGWGDALYPDDAERTIAAWKECVKSEGIWDIEHRYRGADGQWYPILARGVPVRNENGEIVCWAGINLDISRLKQAEAALRASEELNRKTLQALPAHIAVIDRQGGIIAVNHAWEEFARHNDADGSPSVTVGANYCEVCRRATAGKDSLAEVALRGIEAVLNGTSEQFMMEYPCHSPQEERWFFMTVAPLGLGGENGAVITHLNISERVRFEVELQKAHDELELRVEKRTYELRAANKEINQLKDRLQAENICLRQEVAREYNFGEIIGQSDSIVNMFEQIEQVSPLNATVLLLGETGTGKGLVARAIHARSARKGRSMITVNCAALPANLIESELFGRERGAFTGSNAQQLGRFELADGGTIFLDEIGEMPLELQSKLLRVIQDGEMERLGSPRTIKVDVRIIAASNRNLQDEIRKGRFREDLFYRLNVFPISIPPLRQRDGDIALLINFFVAKFNKKTGKNIKTVPKNTLNALQEYHWPGNVRELESVVERAVITSPGSSLQILDRFETSRKTVPVDGNIKALVDLERDHILQVLRKTGWRIEGKSGAAALLEINPSTLRARMRKFGIRRQ